MGYAIAIGLTQNIDWDKFDKEELEGEDDVRNYVVILSSNESWAKPAAIILPPSRGPGATRAR